MSEIPKRLVVFLGAGASAPYGFPVTSQIWAGLQTDEGSDRWRKWGGLEQAPQDSETLVQLFKVLLPGLEARGSVDGASNIDVNPMVDQLVAERRCPSPQIDLPPSLKHNWR